MKIWYKRIMGDMCYVAVINGKLIDITEEQAQQFIGAGIEAIEGEF